MNGINNQSINPAITQDSNAALSTTFGDNLDFLANSPQDGFQELARNTNEVEDFFHFSPNGQEIPAIPASLEETGMSSVNFSSGIPQELAAIAEKTSDIPLHRDEIEAAPPQEAQDVNAAKPSKQEFIQKKKLAWTEEENKRFIELKQQQPGLAWKDFAKYFPGYTEKQCQGHWYNVFTPRLYKQGKLTDPNAKDMDPTSAHGNSVWSQEKNKRFIELKQQQPELPWKDFAKYFPEYTETQCHSHWYHVLALRLYKQKKLTDPNAEDKDPAVNGNEKWSQEENKRFIELKQQQPELPWEDFAKYFPKHTERQCQNHWYNTLKTRLIRKRESPPDQNIDIIQHLSKRSRIELPSSSIPATFDRENPSPFMNSSPAISQELAGISAPSLSHAFPIQQTSRDEQKKFLDLSFHQYEVAVHHFQEIQLTDPLLQSIQREAAQCLANTQMTYQVIKQRLTIEASLIPILQQATSLITFCKTNTYYLETVYQHFLSYQANPESKEWFSSQSVVFTSLYCAFLTGNMEEAAFRRSLSLKGRDYSYQNLNNLFIHLKNVFKNHSSCFGLEYNKFIETLFFNIEFQLNLLKDNQQNWMSITSLLKETISRMQEIEIFFQFYFNIIPSIETEANIISRLKNEISLQDFYAKQTAEH